MGERTSGLNDPALLELQLESIRGNLTGIVRELDHRRHDLTDWRGQLVKHKTEVGYAVGGLALLLGGVGVAALLVKRHNRQPAVRMREMGKALKRIAGDPSTLARPQSSLVGKLVGAALTTLVGVTVKQAATTLLNDAKTRRALPSATDRALSVPGAAYEALNPPR